MADAAIVSANIPLAKMTQKVDHSDGKVDPTQSGMALKVTWQRYEYIFFAYQTTETHNPIFHRFCGR